MTAIDITALTDEQKAKIAADYAAAEKAKKEKKAADKKLLKGLENDVVLKVIDFFIDYDIKNEKTIDKSEKENQINIPFLILYLILYYQKMYINQITRIRN